MYMLFLCHYAVVLVRNIKLYGKVYYFLSGSHSRNSRDITDDQPGHSILTKFVFLYEVERCIEEAYYFAGRVYAPRFQVQSITVNIDNTNLVPV